MNNIEFAHNIYKTDTVIKKHNLKKKPKSTVLEIYF